ncbi:MAG: hypothetical protein SangKO_097450 [Sandaracinaceae bacterium]
MTDLAHGHREHARSESVLVESLSFGQRLRLHLRGRGALVAFTVVCTVAIPFASLVAVVYLLR